MIWAPHVTVAAVIEDGDRYLLVEEDLGREHTIYNQPAGHLDPDESLIQAVIRETLEETAHHFEPEAVVGVYRWTTPDGATTYLRVCFTGRLTGHEPDRSLDTGIVAPRWLQLDEIRALFEAGRLRSPLVLRCVEDLRAGQRFPLGLLTDM